MKLHRHLGISYNAAWRMRHKLMQVMMERDRAHPLGGSVQLDDAYLGGERSGGKRGRGAPGKTPFVAAVETNEPGHPLRVKLTVVEGFRLTEIAAWAQQHLSPGTEVLSDGLACFNGVTAAGCVHEPVVTGGGKGAVERPEFRWVNTILGNIKSALRGTYHAIRPKYAQRYLAEFEYRFNRRFDLPDIIPRLVYVALRTPPDAGTATQVALSLRGNQDGLRVDQCSCPLNCSGKYRPEFPINVLLHSLTHIAVPFSLMHIARCQSLSSRAPMFLRASSIRSRVRCTVGRRRRS